MENDYFMLILVIMIFFIGCFTGFISKRASKMEDKSEEILAEIKELKRSK